MTQRQADYQVGLPQTTDKVPTKLPFSAGALCFYGGGEQHLRISTMLAWATLPANTHRNWLAKRLSIVRGFASRLHTIDSATEVPPTDLLSWQRCHATPYPYSDDEAASRVTAASSLRKGYRVLTFQTLVGLLAATGMRVGEAP